MEETGAASSTPKETECGWTVQVRSKKRQSKPKLTTANGGAPGFPATGGENQGRTTSGLSSNPIGVFLFAAKTGTTGGKGPAPPSLLKNHQKLKPPTATMAEVNRNREGNLPGAKAIAQKFHQTGNPFGILKNVAGSDDGALMSANKFGRHLKLAPNQKSEPPLNSKVHSTRIVNPAGSNNSSVHSARIVNQTGNGNSFAVLDDGGAFAEGSINAPGRDGAVEMTASNRWRAQSVPADNNPAKPIKRAGPKARPTTLSLTGSNPKTHLDSQNDKDQLSLATAIPGKTQPSAKHVPSCDEPLAANHGMRPVANPETALVQVNQDHQSLPIAKTQCCTDGFSDSHRCNLFADGCSDSPRCNLFVDIEWDTSESLPTVEETFTGALVPFRLSGQKKKLNGNFARNSTKEEDSNHERANKLAKVQDP